MALIEFLTNNHVNIVNNVYLKIKLFYSNSNDEQNQTQQKKK